MQCKVISEMRARKFEKQTQKTMQNRYSAIGKPNFSDRVSKFLWTVFDQICPD